MRIDLRLISRVACLLWHTTCGKGCGEAWGSGQDSRVGRGDGNEACSESAGNCSHQDAAAQDDKFFSFHLDVSSLL